MMPEQAVQSVPEVRFYRSSEKPWGPFSNLFRRPVFVNGTTFPTNEHAYQAMKPRRPEVMAWLLAAPTPALLAGAAHALLPWEIAPGWSRARYPWMMTCLRAKFGQHEDLRALLLGTGDARIVEAGTVDNEVNRRWGEVNGVGRNLLGRMLMRVRAEHRGPTYPDAELDELLARAAADED